MDVRCEKCQTEYELDEARLKPGGVTVKCTNCGHMFKIRKRSNTNAGTPAPVMPTMAGMGRAGSELGLGGETVRQRPVSSKPPGTSGGMPRNDDDPTLQTDAAPDRMWLIRLENGEQKSCRELATLQQWIIAGVVTRDSLISRSGKTWKSLGDIAELQQYFVIAEEARETRQNKPTKPPLTNTMVGHSTGGGASGKASAAPEDDEARSTGTFKARRGTTQPPPPPLKTPPLGSPTSGPAKVPTAAPPMVAATKPPPPAVNPLAQTMAAPEKVPVAPPPPAKAEKASTWAAMPERPQVDSDGDSGPRFGGKIAAISDEPAFAAGRVRVEPADESSFRTGKVRLPDDDDEDDVVAKPRGSRAGLWITLIVLILGGGGAAAYFLVIKKAPATVATIDGGGSGSGSDVATGSGSGSGSSAAVVTATPDAAITQPADPLDAPKKALAEDVEARLRDAMKTLADQTDPEALGLRAHIAAQLAQDLLDRAGLVTDKAEAEALRKESHTIVIDAATSAQKSHKAKPESGVSNLAMAEVLRLQSKRAADIKRYADAAAGDKAWRRDADLAAAMVHARDGKLDDAKAAFAAIDGGDGKLETSGDVRARFHLALIAFAQNKAPDAKQLVQQVLAAQPEHAAARVLASRLETVVASSDPLPPEDHGGGGGPKVGSGSSTGSGSGSGSAVVTPPAGGGGSYDSYMAEANKIADTNCTRALELYQKAVDIKPDSAEAHTGMGYCFIESKQFSSAQSKFRTALRFAPKYEPALFGIAEAYQQQGRKDDAIEAFKQYLQVFPGASKAVKALERLGVTDPNAAPTPPQNPTPPTPPPPTPPTPPAEGSGSGSG